MPTAYAACAGRSKSTTSRRKASGTWIRMPGAVAGVGLGARGTAVVEVAQRGERLRHDVVAGHAGQGRHERDATGVVLVAGVVEPLGRRECVRVHRAFSRRRLRRPHALHDGGRTPANRQCGWWVQGTTLARAEASGYHRVHVTQEWLPESRTTPSVVLYFHASPPVAEPQQQHPEAAGLDVLRARHPGRRAGTATCRRCPTRTTGCRRSTRLPSRVHRGEPLVVVVVAGQRDVDVVAVGDAPRTARIDALRAVLGARGVARVVHGDRGARRGVRVEVVAQPGGLGRGSRWRSSWS